MSERDWTDDPQAVDIYVKGLSRLERERAQAQRNLQVMRLLAESWAAHARDEKVRSHELADQAAQVDADATTALLGGMKIGEVPEPGTPAWDDYVAAARDKAAELER